MITTVMIAMPVTMTVSVTVTLVMSAMRCLHDGQCHDSSKAGTSAKQTHEQNRHMSTACT